MIFFMWKWLIDNRYISANVPKTDQVKNMFALMLGEMYPVKLCLHILPDASLHISAGSWSGHRHVFGCVRLFECNRAVWIAQQKVVESAGKALFYGDFDNENDNCYDSI